MDHWGSSHSRNNPLAFATTLNSLMARGINVNIYLFHGGTSFGFSSGASINETTWKFQSCVNSYDYDAPLSEAGDPTELYFTIKKIIANVRTNK